MEPIVFASCAGNEEVSLRNRYLKSTPPLNLNRELLAKCVDELIHDLRPHFDAKLTYDEFMEGKKGALGERYLKAVKELLEDGFDIRKDASCSPFVKNEKYFEDKPPRCVFSRNPKFNTLIALYTIPVEHALTKLPYIAKGCDFAERGSKFSNVWEQNEDITENDFSKFESTQRVPLLDQTMKKIFSVLYPGDQFIMDLYELSHHKNGETLRGLKIKFFGMLASGEMFTGLQNCILNALACKYFEKYNNFPWSDKFLCDGDDGIIRTPRNQKYVNTFEHFGFSAKLITRTDYHDVEFCSSKFIQITPGVFYQVQNINKLLNSIPYMINPEFNQHLDSYYSSLGYMYEVVYMDLPIYSDIAKFLQTCNKSNLKVNTKILEKTSYGAYNAFRYGKHTLKTDYNLCLIELSMCFDLSMIEIEEIQNFFKTRTLDFPPEYCKRYKSRDRKPTNRDDINFESLKAIEFIGKMPKRPKGYRLSE